jgi:hypothetical protein
MVGSNFSSFSAVARMTTRGLGFFQRFQQGILGRIVGFFKTQQ